MKETLARFSSKISSTSSISSSYIALSEDRPVYSQAFWKQFSREKIKGKDSSLLLLIKGILKRKRKKDQEPFVTPCHSFQLSPMSHPPGLYCVIDEFLATYSDGSELITDTDDEEYGVVRDSIENFTIDEGEYSEIIGARLYQNIIDVNHGTKNVVPDIPREVSQKDDIKNVCASIILDEAETAVD